RVDAKVYDLLYGASLQPGPCRTDRWAVDRIVLQRIVARDDDTTRSAIESAKTIEATESLPQRIETGTFSNQTIEVEIRSHLDALRRDDDNRGIGRTAIAAGTNASEQSLFERIAIERSHPAR